MLYFNCQFTWGHDVIGNMTDSKSVLLGSSPDAPARYITIELRVRLNKLDAIKYQVLV